ncbi:ferrichrome ABC transporter permease [Solibacillus sp. R5-41]|uniref:FecCD family ABC transporter permease n=1 Tax=Solibacillus sp. R5-41 TaxID=2048654 RepID=UPI000C124FD8|nr:iron ABC transporter permease [Solibacillus sp. R5-41]ATP39828.1 ferrichrome ABC transporter permease [Solibacillus sp. R5-41]
MKSNSFLCKTNRRPFYVTIFVSTILLAISLFIAIVFGAKPLPFSTVWAAIWHFDTSNIEHQILYSVRFPRVLAAGLVGAAFAVAGALMQGVTRNPLADVGVLGINAGATFVVALSFVFFPDIPFSLLMVLSFLGATCTTLFIFLLGMNTPGGLTPLKLTLAGTVIASLLHSLTSGIAIYFELSQDLAFWYAGGVAGVEWPQLVAIAPILIIVLIGAMLLGKSLSIMAMGEEMAVNLGLNTKRIRLIAIVFALMLAGVSVAAVGSIAFVGLIIPHIARKFVGVDYRFVLPVSAILGALLLVVADLLARTIDPPKEFAIGVIVAMIGVPFFLYISRKENRTL